MQYDYSSLKTKYTKNLWKKLEIKRRAGIMCPLFSIYSKNSIGIGEFPDLKLVIDLCEKTKNTILQLLPLNEAGYGNSPYSAYSSFAMDPVYLSLTQILGNNLNIEKDLAKLKKKLPNNTKNVNYQIRAEKLSLLEKIFQHSEFNIKNYENFKIENDYWLEDYANYKITKNSKIKTKNEVSKNPEFYKWIQWQAFEQMKKVSLYARKKKIKIMGDIPFLVSMDSADVFGKYKEIFNLENIAGCPPDAYNSHGQRWGMPTYNWQKLKETKYQYFKDKLKYAENFFDMYRIDHVVGVFRLWSIKKDEPQENGGLYGQFDPVDESQWQKNGESILKAMIDSSSMMPCAEDLGVVPDQCTKTLKKLGIAGLDVQRWKKNRKKNPRQFIKPKSFRKISCAVSSSHDMSNSAALWLYELNTTDEWCFKKTCQEKNINFNEIAPKIFDLENSQFGRLRWKKDITTEDLFLWNVGRPKAEILDLLDSFYETQNEKNLLLKSKKQKNTRDIVYDLLQYTSSSASIFCIHSLLDLILLESDKLNNLNIEDIWGFRVNFPGSVGDHNWSIRIPCDLESLKKTKISEKIFKINTKTDRL